MRRHVPRLLVAAALLAALWSALIWWRTPPTSASAAAEPQPRAAQSPQTEQAKRAAAAASTAQSASSAKTATVSSGISIRLIRRPPLLVPAPPYAAAYARLLPQAQAGDAKAQYQLGLLLYQCRDVPADETTLERQIERVYETRRREGWDVDDPAAEEQTLRRQYAECAGVPAESRGQYRDWLKSAADAGLLEAELDLPLHLPPGEYCQYLSECSPQQRAIQETLQQEAIEYLGRARDQGSVQALWTFGAWYAEGEVLPENDVEAYADFDALNQIFAAAGDPRNFDAILADLRSRLRPADLEQAQARSKEILSNPQCCVLPP
jgi:TPR repeat protein